MGLFDFPNFKFTNSESIYGRAAFLLVPSHLCLRMSLSRRGAGRACFLYACLLVFFCLLCAQALEIWNSSPHVLALKMYLTAHTEEMGCERYRLQKYGDVVYVTVPSKS